MEANDLLTRKDLLQFEQSLIDKISELLKIKKPQEQEWLRSRDVKKLLGISSGTLQSMRIRKVLPFSKLNGSIFYSMEDIQNILNKNRQNIDQ